MMKKVFLFGIIGAILLTLTACGRQLANAEAAAADYEESDTENETTAKAGATFSAMGQVTSTNIENIIIDFSSAVEKINVREGQKVNYGDTLVTLNINEINSQIRSKELELSSQQKAISSIGNSNSNPDVQKLQNELENAQNAYNKALYELTVKKQLFEAGGISKYDFDNAQKTVDESKNAVDNIKLSIQSLKNSKQTELTSRYASAALLASDLQALKDKLNKSYLRQNEIICDVQKGVVSNIGYVSGDITSSSKKLLTLMDLDALIVKTTIPERTIKSIKVGSDVVMIPRADNSMQYKGKIISISNAPVSNNGEASIPVEISIDNNDGFLLPNYIVNLKININKNE